ncbi:MAG TPA: HU family DNA-binding protein [Geminicoccaceae bacterium]|nr:HU family DNA-binding protein [Geminicoccaceae bacterium]
MTLDDLNDAVASRTGMPKAKAAEAVQAVIRSIQEALSKGEKLSIAGLGVFEVVNRPERDGRNPQTGQAIKIAASNAVKFKPGKGLRDAVNG